MVKTMSSIEIMRIDKHVDFPDWLDPDTLAIFLHEALKPFEDPVDEIRAGIDYAISTEAGMGGFILIAHEMNQPVGALVVLRTGMRGYVPPNLILYVAVDPDKRGKRIGHKLMMKAIEMCEGNIKLHVEYDNHARKWYEGIGFKSKYVEMRLKN